MRKNITSLIAAAGMSANLLLSVSVYAKASDMTAFFPRMNGAEERIVRTHRISDYVPTDNASDEYGLGTASEAEKTEGQPFYEYSNTYYETKYGYGNGRGYAYADIIENRREYLDLKTSLYGSLLDACRAFTTNYADVDLFTVQTIDGDVSMYRLPGTDDMVLSLNDTDITLGYDDSYEIAENIIYEVYFTFRDDHPEYYWLSNAITVFFDDSENQVIVAPKVFDEFIYGELRMDIDKRMQGSIDGFLEEVYQSDYYSGESMDAYYICDILRTMLTAATDYGWQDENRTISLDSAAAHSIVSMLDGDESTLSVCEGYAKSFQLLLNKLGIDNIYITGYAGTNNENHAWNMVRLPDDFYYYFDITWEDSNPYAYFAKGSISFSNEGGGHRAGSSSMTGAEFLYDLPEVPENNYRDTADRPELWAGSVKISDLYTDYIGKGYSKYESTDILQINITKDGEDAVYGTDYIAVKNGERLITFGSGQFPDGKNECSDIEIYAVKGVNVEVIPIARNKENATYGFLTSAGRNVTIGKTVRYTDERIGDSVDYRGNYSTYGIEVYRPNFDVTKEGGGTAVYGVDYIAEYKGHYLYNNQYRDIMNGYIEEALGTGVSGIDVFENLVIRVVNDIDISYSTIIKISDGRTGILPVGNRSFALGLYPSVHISAPLCADLTISREDDNIYVAADGDIPDGCNMYVAVYRADGTLKSAQIVSGSAYTHQIAEGDAVLKAFIFDKKQYPAADVQVIRLL